MIPSFFRRIRGGGWKCWKAQNLKLVFSNSITKQLFTDVKYDQATANLKELLDKRDAIRKEEILSAVVKSGRSYEEIMNFLNAGPDGEKTEK